MGIIKILPENLVNQIAAGEVVERPASVVKELLENSIDAGASRIILEINGAGDELIRITDNGCGMDKKDAKLAFERHATSKINNADDLFNISSFGFRGEAIASIASVSHMSLKTKRQADTVGTLISCIGGVIKRNEEVSCIDGTQIEVKNLFYNTPARKKYLKTPSTEYQNIIAIFQGIALMNKNIHFKLVHNEKLSFEYPTVTKLIDRVRDVLGKNVVENLLPIFYESTDLQLEGFIGKPELGRSGTKHQYLFVNGRKISHHLFSYAIGDAYHSLLMDGKKPFYLINIKINPALVDVNVHPRKLEIRFQNQNEIFKLLQTAAKKTLEKNVLMPRASRDSGELYEAKTFKPSKTPSQNQIKAALEFTKQISGKTGLNKYSYKQEEQEDLSMKPLAQIAKSYILAENAEGLVLIDQHAAHERIKYEELMDQLEKKLPEKQQLLLPLEIELSGLEIEMFETNKKVFEDLGFEIESFGGNTFIIYAVPSPIANQNVQAILQQVLSDLNDNKSTRAIKNPQEKIIEYMACRSAIKFGKDLSRDEMIELIKEIDKLNRPYTCPHGRPSMVQLTYNELEKMFKRK